MCDVVRLAGVVAWAAHAGQTDKAGNPYFGHPERVAARARDAGADDEVVAAAYLHDVVEDTGLTREDLHRMGFPTRTVRIVSLLTKDDGTPYAESIERAASDPDAALVKWCDVMDNADPNRLALLDRETRERLKTKYRKALATLASASR